MKHEPVLSGKRRTIELSLPEEHVADAEALAIDLEQLTGQALTAGIKRERERRWKEENREAIESWNRWIEKHGSPLDRYRAF